MPKLGQILIFQVFLFSCKTTNAGFVSEKKLFHHKLEMKYSGGQARIRLLANAKFQDEKKDLSFLLDTGSNISLIRKDIFAINTKEKIFRLKSLTGENDKNYIELTLNIFDANKNIIQGNFSFFSLEIDSKFNFDGIIGNNILEKFDLFLELPETAILIKQTSDIKNLNGFQRVPFQFLEGHILVKGKLSNFPCVFILDTGAGISYINNSKAIDLNLKKGEKASYIDLNGQIQEAIYRLGENLCVAENICQEKIELLSGNSIVDFLSGKEKIDGILGLNWIEKYSILIDFQNSSLYIKQR